MSKKHKTADEWRQECTYCSGIADVRGHVLAFSHDTAVFVRYLKMQKACAESDGQYDAATYLEHIIDDMDEACDAEPRVAGG